jgi:hypothetical protein
MSGKLKITGSTVTPDDPINVRAYCEGRQYAKDGGSLTYATGTTGVVASNNAILWTADNLGDGLRIALVNPGGLETPIRAVADAGQITVTLETDEEGVAISTAAEVIEAIAANAPSAALVSAANKDTSTGAAAVTVQSIVLTGSSHPRATGDLGVAFAAGVASWTANPSGVVTRDCCALPYGGGFGT